MTLKSVIRFMRLLPADKAQDIQIFCQNNVERVDSLYTKMLTRLVLRGYSQIAYAVIFFFFGCTNNIRY
jgi:hypothetical protein